MRPSPVSGAWPDRSSPATLFTRCATLPSAFAQHHVASAKQCKLSPGAAIIARCRGT